MTPLRPLTAKLLPLGALLSLPLLPALGRAPVDPLTPERDVASLFPARTLVYVEAPGLPALAAAGLEHPALRAVLDSELGDMLLAQSGQSPEALLAFGALALGRPVLPAVASLTANGAAVGVTFTGGGPVFSLVVHADDDLLVDELLERASAAAEDVTGVGGLFDEPHNTVRGADVWYLDEVVLARRGALVVFGNDEGYVRDVLDHAADAGEEGLLASERFREARAGASGDELVWAFADRARIEEIAGKLPHGAADLKKLYRAGNKPQAQFLLGPGIAALGAGDAYTAQVQVDGTRIRARLSALGAAPYPGVAPHPERPAPAALDAPGTVVSAVLYRDLGGIFEHRAELFEPQETPKISKGLGEIAILFGGLDLGEDVLPALSPWLRVVARPATFGAGPLPEVELPAAALVVRVDGPETVGPALVGAFQNAVALVNVNNAQEGMSGMTLRLSLEGEVQVTSAHLPAPLPGDGVDIEHNLAPACAMAGDAFVLGTHDSLVRDLVRELATGHTAATGAATTETLWLSGAALAEVVAANDETLVAQKVLEDGLSPAEARSEIDGLHALLALFEGARLEVRYGQGDVSVHATAELAGTSGDRRDL